MSIERVFKINNKDLTMSMDSYCVPSLVLHGAGQQVYQDSTYGGHLVAVVGQLWRDGLYCDYTLLAGNVKFRVHKLVFAALSDYFGALFESGMKECHSDSLDLKGISAKGLKAVVEFVYSGQLVLDSSNVFDVLAAGNHLQIKPIVKLCCEYLFSETTLDNVQAMLGVADIYDLMDFKALLKDFILRNFRKFVETIDFRELEITDLIELLKENSLSCPSEYELFQYVMDWINYDLESRGGFIGDLLDHIRLPRFSTEDLRTISRLPLISKDPKCMALLSEAWEYHSQPHLLIFDETPKSQVRNNPCIVAIREEHGYEDSCYAMQDDEWIQLDIPCHFEGAAATVVNNHLFVCGGTDHSTMSVTKAAWCFEPATSKWTNICPMNKSRSVFALAAYNNHLYAIGGICNPRLDNTDVTETMEVYSIENDMWSYGSPYDMAVCNNAACMYQDTIWVAAGVDLGCNSISDFKAYDPPTDTWERKEDILGTVLRPKLFAQHDQIYLLDLDPTEGGLAHLQSYNICADQWSPIRLPSIQLSRQFGAAVMGDWIYFVGRNDVEYGRSKKYNCVTKETREIQSFPEHSRAPMCFSLCLPQGVLQHKPKKICSK